MVQQKLFCYLFPGYTPPRRWQLSLVPLVWGETTHCCSFWMRQSVRRTPSQPGHDHTWPYTHTPPLIPVMINCGGEMKNWKLYPDLDFNIIWCQAKDLGHNSGGDPSPPFRLFIATPTVQSSFQPPPWYDRKWNISVEIFSASDFFCLWYNLELSSFIQTSRRRYMKDPVERPKHRHTQAQAGQRWKWSSFM